MRPGAAGADDPGAVASSRRRPRRQPSRRSCSARPTCSGSPILLVVLPAARGRVRRPDPLPARVHPHRSSRRACRSAGGPGAAATVQPVAPAHRHAAARGPSCPTRWAAGPGSSWNASAGQRASAVAYTVRAEVRGPLRGRTAGRPAHRPVRTVRADPVVRRDRPAHRRPAGRPLPDRPAAGDYAGSGDSRARSVAVPARTTSRPASTATATTCAGCTGARPPGPAS